MPDHKTLYFTLFNAVTDAIGQMEAHEYSLAVLTLERAQRASEDLYIKSEEPEAG